MKSKGTESTHCFNKLAILYQNCVLSPRAYQHHFSFSQLIPSTRPKKKKKRQNAICAVSEWALKFTTSMRFKRIVVFWEHTRAAYFNLMSTIVGLMKNEPLCQKGKWNFPPSQVNARGQAPVCFLLGSICNHELESLQTTDMPLSVQAHLSSTPLTRTLIFEQKEAELLLGEQPGKYLTLG